MDVCTQRLINYNVHRHVQFLTILLRKHIITVLQTLHIISDNNFTVNLYTSAVLLPRQCMFIVNYSIGELLLVNVAM